MTIAIDGPNPAGKLINCLSCGRDTCAKSGYCSRCLGHTAQISDTRDRPVLGCDGDPVVYFSTGGIHEDDYSEESK